MIEALAVEPLPGLVLAAVRAHFAQPLGELPPLPVPSSVVEIDADLRTAVRDVLRQRGYRPTGRGKPSSEYLANALAEGRWPCINAAVDAGNLASLVSGLPISVVDLDLLRGPVAVRVAADGARYVFNQGGQEIELAGLPCLFDADGPCANAVKDAQRTKTTASTARVLGVVWGVEAGQEGRASRARDDLAARWRAAGGVVEDVAVVVAG